MSRDWVIDKFTINVAYDSDVVKVKKDVKGVGPRCLSTRTADHRNGEDEGRGAVR